jgi:hypothetical protein
MIYLVVEALRQKERHDETQFITNFGGKTNLSPNYFVLFRFVKFSFLVTCLMPCSSHSWPLIARLYG